MLTTYAKQYLYCLASFTLIALSVGALGLAFDLYAMGWPAAVVGLLPAGVFLGGAFCAYRAEALQADAVPPCLTHYTTSKGV